MAIVRTRVRDSLFAARLLLKGTTNVLLEGMQEGLDLM